MSPSLDLEPRVIASGNNSGYLPRNRVVNTENSQTSNDNESDEGPSHSLLPSELSQKPRQLPIETNVRAGTSLSQIDDMEQTEPAKEQPITWRSLPRKDQLFVITLARLSEPLTQTSLGSYLFYQLQSFDKTLPDATIAYQAGIINAAFPFAQFLTAMIWGRVADSEYGGRKRVIYFGLLGTMCSIIGFGFSQSFPMAVACRCIGGVLNGNIGVMRTMISEIIKEKKYQSRAFLILPITFNIGVIIGPILGGILADPVNTYPSLFGPDSFIGGNDGVSWMKRWPYALPNIMSACFLLFSALAVIFFLEETNELCTDKPDLGLRIGRVIRRYICCQNTATESGYTAIPNDDFDASNSLELQPTPTSTRPPSSDKTSKVLRQKLPFRRIWTRNLILTLLAHGIMAMHVGGFNTLWFIYLSAPRFDPAHPHPPAYKPHGFVHFTGGLALPPRHIGIALAILGVIGISLQLFLYPKLSHRLGTAKSYRIFLALFPVAHTLAPFLSRVPSWSAPPAGVNGPFVWIAIIGVLFIQVLARTFALPCTTILVNNVSPHPSVLGTVHGIGQSVSSLTRTVGPIMFSWAFGKGLNVGIVGLGWWLMAAVASVGFIAAQWVREGDGHEILLEGEVKGKDGEVSRID
ncbi:major facilitator superfamily domain-containing protein [Boeremia exigua]|uniref:major facilitator superfamily domain-containing protein n=1 Tax=Boeremia exigua TaxID=749465 RepID=UPI001E8E6877|nr:major facilitator superfamily domain-containing protein [Boeremia exigua]KAH6629219.1 major facilitator superfamily domain-containing protein [Boeremia exigua]